MSISKTNLCILRGDTANFDVTITDGNNASVDLTGAVIRMTVKQDPKDEDIDSLISASSPSDGINITDAVNGLFEIELSTTKTDVVSGTYNYDIQIILNSGDTKTPIIGEIEIVEDITKDNT